MAKSGKTTTRNKIRASRAEKVPTSTKRRKSTIGAPVDIGPEERWRMIAVAAYHLAEKRGFAPGREVDDWLEAERAVNELIGSR